MLQLLLIDPPEFLKENGNCSDNIPARPVDMNPVGK